MKISRPNCLHLIDLEQIFVMVPSFLHCNERFKVITKKTQKNWSWKSHNNEDMEKYQVIKPCPLLRSIMWLPIVNMVLKLSKFQSAAISLIMKISRPNCLHLIDLEKLFPMVSSIFALWWAVPKLSAKNRQKSEAKVKFSKFQSVTISLIMKISRPNVLRLIDLEKLFPMLLPFCTVMSGSKVIVRKPN